MKRGTPVLLGKGGGGQKSVGGGGEEGRAKGDTAKGRRGWGVQNFPVLRGMGRRKSGYFPSITQSIFYFMSVHIEVILDKNKKQKHIIYTNFPTGL